jgi:copper chaperone NosL
MTKLNRILVLLASVLLVTTYIFPLWEISLWAPQYPEGLSMQIWSSKFTGDVQTINILNHYIGMQAIQESSFPELQYFKIIFGILIGLGLITAFLNKRFMVYLWTVSMLSFAFWGLYDFWKWEYEFGHNLNPDAAIKMDDMVYQPPLLGTKDFLNIQASSWPELAGMAFTLAVVLSLVVSVLCIIEGKKASGVAK